jgi:hypothetical protein
MAQHQVALTGVQHAYITIDSQTATLHDIPQNYESYGRERVVYHYEGDQPYQAIVDVMEAASRQVASTVQQSALRNAAVTVFNVLVEKELVAPDYDPLDLYTPDSPFPISVRLAHLAETALPIYGAVIAPPEAE